MLSNVEFLALTVLNRICSKRQYFDEIFVNLALGRILSGPVGVWLKSIRITNRGQILNDERIFPLQVAVGLCSVTKAHISSTLSHWVPQIPQPPTASFLWTSSYLLMSAFVQQTRLPFSWISLLTVSRSFDWEAFYIHIHSIMGEL
jgi:hypothetical protein